MKILCDTKLYCIYELVNEGEKYSKNIEDNFEILYGVNLGRNTVLIKDNEEYREIGLWNYDYEKPKYKDLKYIEPGDGYYEEIKDGDGDLEYIEIEYGDYKYDDGILKININIKD